VGLQTMVLDLLDDVLDLFLGRIGLDDDDHGDPFLSQWLWKRLRSPFRLRPSSTVM
jgi:hypothetical protein